MENSFKPYWDVVQRRMPAVLALSAALALVAYLAVGQRGPTFEVHFSYLVSLSEREAAEEFRFDDYYALSATDLFTSTLAEWLVTPNVIVAAYREAGLDVPDEEPARLARTVTAQKKAPQLVGVVVRGQERQQTERLASGLKEVMTEKIDVFQDQGGGALRFSVYPTDSSE